MKSSYFRILFRSILALVFSLLIGQTSYGQISFTPSNLSGVSSVNPTSIQFGPDGRLYVSERYGTIRVYTVTRDSANAYRVTNTEVINAILDIENHNDDGTLSPGTWARQITGIYVTGTSSNPILYVTSSDPREAVGFDLGLDTNSGIITKLTWNGSSWDHVDLVRGLPRSEENHSINGLQIDETNNILYTSIGGITNMGAPSINFGLTPEYALSAAIISVDLNYIESLPTQTDPVMPDYKYDLPTLDDEDRPGAVDANDPFGGNDGKNQAVLVPGGPIQIFSSGWRNAYDVLLTENGNFFSIDNGPNNGWGGTPISDSITGNCLNTPNENNTFTHCDQLHYIPSAGFYAGHPNPTRQNRANKFNDTIFYNGGLDTILPQSPIPAGMEDLSCEYRVSPLTAYCSYHITNYPDDGALAVSQNSTNGLCEYTASNFNGALQGEILAADLSGVIWRFWMDSTEVALRQDTSQTILFSNFGSGPLDVIAQGDNDIFPGVVVVANYGSSSLTFFEPDDISNCDTSNASLDADNDGFTNGDEIANGTNPCSAADQPKDFDGDKISDLLDTDDDNDGINDTIDFYAQDSTNGIFTTMPVSYQFNNVNDGGIQNWGFTGLMTDNRDYLDKYNLDLMTVGGAAIKFTADSATSGTATGTSNNQDYGFQFGLNVASESDNYTVKARAMAPFATIGGPPVNDQSFGLFIGTGDQDNYLKIVCHANSGAGGILVEKEVAGVTNNTMYSEAILGSPYIDLFLIVNPNNNTVQPTISIGGGAQVSLGLPISIPSTWIDSVLAVGFISTSGPSLGNGFPVTWDFIEAYRGPISIAGNWNNVPQKNTPQARHENAFINADGKFYLIGGRGIKPVQEFNPVDSLWTNRASTPIEMHHFQAVELDGLVYIVGAYTGGFPNETPIPNVYIYNPLTDVWTVGKEIPSSRRRGSAAAVVYNDKIYIAGGITNGHISGTVNWFDVYDPYANTWDSLPDIPRVRDHIAGAIANDKLVLAGGRITGGAWPTVAETDVYNFTNNIWTTLPSPAGDIPTQRAGCCAVSLGDEVIIIGGESNTQTPAFNESEALDVNTFVWRTLDSLNTGRHGTQAIVSNDGIYTVCGSGNQGGGPELNSMEAFYFSGITQPDTSGTIESNLVSTPANLNFGGVLVNTSSSSILGINNLNGNQATVITNISITGASEFELDSASGIPSVPFILSPGDNFSLTINFSPINAGIHNATLELSTTSAASPYSVSLSSEGLDTLSSLTRINSGGPLYTATGGESYIADNYFVGGASFTSFALDTIDILNTVEDSLYESERFGSLFGYKVPVLNDFYEVKLHFAEIFWDAPGGIPGGVGSRIFDVSIEGNTVLTNYDIYAAAGGAVTAVVESFIVNVTDDTLNIELDASVDQAKISAIEIIPSNPILFTWYLDSDNDNFGDINVSLLDSIQPLGYVADSTDCDDSDSLVYPGAAELLDGKDNDCDGLIDENVLANVRINCGETNYVSVSGELFVDDTLSNGGTTFINYALDSVGVGNTLDDFLYRSERSDTAFSYNIPFTDTSFLVKLHFAEIYWGAINGGPGGNGLRVFDVVIEGDTVLNDYDITADVGGAEIAVIKDFNIICLDGTVNIDFIASVDNAKISAIELIADTSGQSCSLVVNESVVNATCNGDTDGSIDISVTAGTPPYTYAWSTGASSEDITNLSAGTYNVTVSDNAGCTIQKSYSVTEPGAINANIVANGPTSFCGTIGVELEAVLNSDYTYQWRRFGNPISGATSNTYFAVQSGNHTCEITDTITGCSAISNLISTTRISNPTSVILTSSPIEMCGSGPGVLIAQTEPQFTYQWLRYGNPAPGNNTDTIYNASKRGNYKLRVTDTITGCSKVSARVVVIKNQLPKTVLDNPGPVSACIGSTFTLRASSARGTPPFIQYEWFRYNTLLTGQTDDSLVVSINGGYSCRITDSKGCANKSERTVVIFDTCGYNCNTPVITSINNLTATSATIGWSTASTAPQFEIRYKEPSDTSYISAIVSGTQYTYDITGLDTSTTYEVEVRAFCANPSSWSNKVSFTTNSSRIGNENLSLNDLSISAYPNPTRDNIELLINSPISSKSVIILSDLTGRQILQEEINVLGGNNFVSLDLSILKQGLYLIHVEIEGYKQFVKVLKN